MGGAKMTNGWNMLDSYREGQVIYGRDQEISQISECIIDNIQTFLYGKSGIGKTSLLQAGIFPKLRKSRFFPVIIRLAFYENEALIDVVKRLVEEEAVKEEKEIEKPSLTFSTIDGSDVSESHLYEYFAKMSFSDDEGIPYIPVLVFDQFEETINNEDNWQRTVDFLRDNLYDLMDNSIVPRGASLDYTNYRIIFSMREDYLYCLEDIVDQYSLWELRYNRFRVRALDDEKAKMVIRETCGANGLESGKEDQIIDTIIRIVKANSGSRFKEINTALLSLVCSLLSENAETGCIYYNDLRKINSYISSYYDDICNKMKKSSTRYLESHLLTGDGRRSSIDENDALVSGKVSLEELNYLVDKKLLRRIRTDSTSTRYEYIHDLFAKMVHKRRSEDKSKWVEPEYRNLSKKLTFNEFLIRCCRALCIPVLFFAINCVGFIFQDNTITWDLFMNNLGFFVIIILLAIYIVPLYIQRLHDSGHSGWLCILFPLGMFFIFIQLFIRPLSGIPLYIIRGIGYILISFLYLLTLWNSRKTRYGSGYSKEYESIFKGTPISNLEFIKSMVIELAFLATCCILVDLLQIICLGGEYYRVTRYKMAFFHMLGIPYNEIPFFAILPFFLLVSPSLKARITQLGYSTKLTYIPYFNILLLLEGLFPDNILGAIGLLKSKKVKDDRRGNDIFVELVDELQPNGSTRIQFKKRDSPGWVFGSMFLPLYAIIYSFKKHTPIGKKQTANTLSLFNSYMFEIVFLFLFGYFLDDNNDILAYIAGIFAVLFGAYFIFSIVRLFICNKELGRATENLLRLHPDYSINTLAMELSTSPKQVETVINKLKRQGKIHRIERNGEIQWSFDNINETSNLTSE